VFAFISKISADSGLFSALTFLITSLVGFASDFERLLVKCHGISV